MVWLLSLTVTAAPASAAAFAAGPFARPVLQLLGSTLSLLLFEAEEVPLVMLLLLPKGKAGGSRRRQDATNNWPASWRTLPRGSRLRRLGIQ